MTWNLPFRVQGLEFRLLCTGLTWRIHLRVLILSGLVHSMWIAWGLYQRGLGFEDLFRVLSLKDYTLGGCSNSYGLMDYALNPKP